MSEAGERHLGLFGATTIGVGAIVGGGILALAGVAFATAGPGAILAFALNGCIAFLTAASFAELAKRFPQSGGAYTYAKRVLPIEVAFFVGWVVWFASIVAGVLYALGFAVFAAEGSVRLAAAFGLDAPELDSRATRMGLALVAIAVYTLSLVRHVAGGGRTATIGKVVVFVVLIGGGAVAALTASTPLVDRLVPLTPLGPTSVVAAMGYTFIALQGFDLIAAVGGEVRAPERNLPRAMYLSLAIALVIYLPLLFLIATVGVAPTVSVIETAHTNPEGLVAEAAERFLGPTGYWLVIGAGLLSMLSALQANLLGASRVAFAMARDRTLPRSLGRIRGASGTPALAIALTATMLAAIVVVIGDVSAAGAASSLIFLVSFGLVHWATILARRRSGDLRLPTLPLLGGLSCIGLAVFQAIAVSTAGAVVLAWLGVGLVAYLGFLAPGARLADTTAEARDPDLARLRGRSPLVLVPVANPTSAASLVGVAATVRTPGVGRVLLLSIVPAPDAPVAEDEDFPGWRDAEAILGESLRRGFERATPTETLFTVAADPFQEIVRVARLHRCETIVLGAPARLEQQSSERLEKFVSTVRADVVLLRAPRRWRIARVRRVLVPLGGQGHHSRLRARLLASLSRTEACEITFLRSVAPDTPHAARRRAEREVRALARDEAEGQFQVEIVEDASPAEAILRAAGSSDLIVMGTQLSFGTRNLLGPVIRDVLASCDTPVILIGSRRA